MSNQPPYGYDPQQQQWQGQQGGYPSEPAPLYPQQGGAYPPPPPQQPGMYPPQDPYGQQAGVYGQPVMPSQPMGMYGQPVGVPYGVPMAPEQGRGQAVAGLVLGIIGMVAWFLPICGLPITIVGLVMSILGRRSISRRTMATVGLVLCIIGLALSVINAVAGAALNVHNAGY